MRRIDDNTLCMIACVTVLVACGAMAEALSGDWLFAWRDLIFGALVVMTFLIARIIYGAIGTLSRADTPPSPYVQREPCEGISRKEAFAANVVTMAHPMAEPHDFQSLPLFETERIIRGGKYSLELIKSCNGEPTLVLCED